MLTFGCPTLIELPTLEETAALTAELGLGFIELNMSFPQYQPECFDLPRFKAVAENYGIFYTLHLDEELNPCCANGEAAAAYVKTAQRSVELAKALDIPVLNMHLLRGIYVTLPQRRTYICAENESLYLEKLRDFRDAVTGAVGDSGIKLCLENTDGYLPFVTHGLDLLLESPVFAMTIDIGHDAAIDFADMPIIMEREDRLAHIHMHDAAGQQVHLPLGEGELDLPAYLELAQRHDCRVLLETKTPEALRHSVAWLRERGYI